MTPNVCMVSFWRNDMGKHLERRAEHLLSKQDVSRWLWVVGDSDDATADVLDQYDDVDIFVMRTDNTDRLRRLSETVTFALEQLTLEDEYVLIHESDLISPVDLATRFLEHAAEGRCPIAGWPVLKTRNAELFYDTWAYRAQGKHFTNFPPYHAVYKANEPFKVDSLGSAWMFHGIDALQGLPVKTHACVEMCENLVSMYGRQCWVDPTIRIDQPEDLWTPQQFPR